MEFDIISKKLSEIEARLSQISKGLYSNTEWLTSEEVCQMLKISKKTLQNYRDKGIIPFSKIANRTYYKRADIENCLEESYSSVFSGRRVL